MSSDRSTLETFSGQRKATEHEPTEQRQAAVEEQEDRIVELPRANSTLFQPNERMEDRSVAQPTVAGIDRRTIELDRITFERQRLEREWACIVAGTGSHPANCEMQARFCPPASSAQALRATGSVFNAFVPATPAFTSSAPYALSTHTQLMPSAMPEQLTPGASYAYMMAGTPAAESTTAPAPTHRQAQASRATGSAFNALVPATPAFTSSAPYALSAPHEQPTLGGSYAHMMAGTPATENAMSSAPTLPRPMDAATRMTGCSTTYSGQGAAAPFQAAGPSASRMMTGLSLDPAFAYDMAGPSTTQMMAGLSLNPAMERDYVTACGCNGARFVRRRRNAPGLPCGANQAGGLDMAVPNKSNTRSP
uniref:Uncharacterized protein n=1 Tax=Anopheles atroparvus TaxID=41427 RepID=A0A182INW1_ANOAO